MFLDFYGLREQPFGSTPNPRQLFLSRTHREALASLYFGIESGCGFMGLVAKPGMGKTTLLFRLLEQLRGTARTVFLFQTQCDSRDLLRYIMADLGLDYRERDFVSMHAQLNEVLLRESRAGRRVVLVLDEAQNLADPVLETIRLLSDFETPSKKLLQIILAGQPELAQKLAQPHLAQLRQRISLLARLEPFGLHDTIGYIESRLKVAGYDGLPLFTPAAIELIAAESHGIPRCINTLCFNALSLGCALGRKRIDPAIVFEVAADLSFGEALEERAGSTAVEAAAPAMKIEPAEEILAAADRHEVSDEAAGAAPDPVPSVTETGDPMALPWAANQPAVPVALIPTNESHAPEFSPSFPGKVLQESPQGFGNARKLASVGGLGAVVVLLTVYALATAGRREQNRAATAMPDQVRTEAISRANHRTGGNPGRLSEKPSALKRATESSGTVGNQSPAIVTHIVRPNETLSRISEAYLGRYDEKALVEIQKLNQQIKDPDLIVTGQEIRLKRTANDQRTGESVKEPSGKRVEKEE
jgi:type II secretory pathway predicted ATPase ExeA/nucleoid-associated protein YgaU